MSRLIQYSGSHIENEWMLAEGETSIGRQRQNQIVILDPRISRVHCTILVSKNYTMLINHSKTHGTHINGMKVDGKIQLGDNDTIKLGDTSLVFRLKDRGSGPLDEGWDESGGGDSEEGDSNEISVAEPIDKNKDDFWAVADPNAVEVANLAGAEAGGEKVKRLYEQIVLIQDIGKQLVAQLDLRALFELILEKVFDLMRVDTGTILLFDAVNKRVAPVALRNQAGPASPQELKISRSMVQFAVRNRMGVLSSDTQSDERFQEMQSIISRGIRSAMCVPMIHLDDILGVIYIDNVISRYTFNQDDLNLLSILANQAAIAVRNAKLCQQIVAEETKRSNLARFLTPQLVDRLGSEDIELGLGGKQVQAAILFSDIRGFTSLSETLTPHQVVQMLNAYFSEMTEIIFEYNGTLDKYDGDAVIAAFGSPVQDEDACLNALRCAVAMQGRLDEMTFQGAPIEIGIGLHYGDIIHGNVGSEQIMQYTIIGDTVNTTSRLCDKAAPGKILFSRNFREGVGRDIDVRALEPVQLKGKAEPMEIFEYSGDGDTLF